jgi:ectoine hydroxylase-related dioxygenase (phytanoyl-CoA dioxygenase family)
MLLSSSITRTAARSLLSQPLLHRNFSTPPCFFSPDAALPAPSLLQPRSPATEPTKENFPLSHSTASDILIYDSSEVNKRLSNSTLSSSCPHFNALASEWTRALHTGPGVIVMRGAYTDPYMIDAVSREFESIILSEEIDGGHGDHFAKAGNNSRIWNAQEKLALKNPHLYVEYYNNTVMAAVSKAWLGPNYQMTSQVNSSHPGSRAQDPHTDYHLGFRGNDEVAEFPAHAHRMSQFLTLQGAIAHVDMPLESGPTTFLPYSQACESNYMLWRREDFKEYYKEHRKQLPLAKGDIVFFNPGLIHAAGDNTSYNVDRMANLIQVNSCFGQAMEIVDRQRICKHVYEDLYDRHVRKGESVTNLRAIDSSAFGNPFPTNLDRDPPQNGGKPPLSQKDVLVKALEDKVGILEFQKRMDAHTIKRRTH